MDHAKRRIYTLISHTIGLNAEQISDDVWERLLQDRMSLTGSANLDAYARLLASSPFEWQELVEKLIVPETWFFRDPAAFEQCVHYYHNWKPSRSHAIMRILSIPCSSGEEPYSAAMALLDARVPQGRFRVDGIDISKIALLQAEKGFYTKHSFRGSNLGYRDRYFDPVNEGFQIKKEVRAHVHFEYGNIYDRRFSENRSLYDLILCRNLLIYLHAEAQKRVLQEIAKLLKPEGELIVTPAEVPLVKRHGFALKHGRAFGRIGEEKPRTPSKPPSPKPKEESKKSVLGKIEDETELLSQAKRYADLREYTHAEKLCRHYLKEQPMDASAHFLLGAIRHAQGDEKGAEESFLKTLYLEPHHDEALVYLALLADNRGDKAQAAHFRRRLKGR